jgi:hypothetical protein
MRELVAPDLDLIKQAKQGDVGVGEGRSRRSLAVDKTATNAGGSLLICCRSNKRVE